MPLYFGKPLSGFNKGPPEFAARKIELLKSDVVSAGYKGLPYIYSALYAAYIYFLPFFMQATVIRKKVQVSRFFVGNYFTIKIDDLMTWTYPDIVVGCLPGKDAEFTLLAKEVGGVILEANKIKSMSIPNVNPEIYRRIKATDVVWDSSCDQGRSNLDDMLGFLHVLRIFSAFLMTHQYPHAYDQPAQHPHKRTKVETYLQEDFDEEMLDEKEKASEINDTEIHFQLIRKAKPSPSAFPFYGAPTSVPFLPGILFPYFPGCILPSHTIISSVVKTYFFSTLGESEEECAETMRSIKRAASSWAISEAGLELQHLAAGIELAIETESRLFVIQEDTKYLGFALLGYGFKIATSNGVVKANSAEDLKLEVERMESRSSVVLHLRNKLGLLALSAGLDEEEIDRIPSVAEMAVSIRSVRKWVIRNGDELFDENPDAKNEVIASMRRIYQSAPFWKVNADTVPRAIVMILDDHPVPDDVPFFISDQVFSDTTKTHEVMAAFGPTGFSLNNQGGTEYRIPEEGEEDIASSLVEVPAGKGRTRKVKAMESVFIALKPMRSCVYDFNQVIAKRVIVQRKERAGAQKYVKLDGEDRDTVWKALIDCFISRDHLVASRRKESVESRPEPVYHRSTKRKFRDDF